ncbi:hypothetical protein [Pseudomonas coleopterorum]|uniref:Uncharacterized protein n=1 Tax=Pseudomonas coleopterorum TaxID=1605838 RepID=A0AAJ6M4J5_9PSED|nr:hypothetical protein [Pseudomonas coleopterorum]WNC12088.1 hypothetical protein RI108_21885 [Pseudomonas coleopterorum]WNC12096.1 hypothetical protein RI108_21845 [Pseudomonas coleopterorum]
MSEVIYLEVDRSNQAILSYFLELPANQSRNMDYVPATSVELTYLNGLEDFVFPPGMVATLSDLEDFRKRLAANKAAATSKAQATPGKPSQKAAQAPQKAVQSSSKATPPATNNAAQANLIAALKKRRSNKK